MSINRLLIVLSKTNNANKLLLSLKRCIATTRSLNVKLNQQYALFGSSHHKSSSSKPDIDEKLIAKLVAEDRTTDKSELDKPEWERSTRNRVHYGFSNSDPGFDKFMMHMLNFSLITLCIVVFGFIVYYMPDKNNKDWCYREAHLEMARRKARGEPLVSPDYVPADQIVLPTEEELGDFEIKI